MLVTFSCEKQEVVTLSDNTASNLVETRNDDHSLRPLGSTTTSYIRPICPFSLQDSGCDAEAQNTTPYLANQVVHFLVVYGGQNATTTSLHPNIPDLSNLYYSTSLGGCDEADGNARNLFNDECRACNKDYYDDFL